MLTSLSSVLGTAFGRTDSPLAHPLALNQVTCWRPEFSQDRRTRAVTERRNARWLIY